MDLQLQGKRAVVTGGSRGIGKAIARSLLGEGVQVALVARGREALEATAAELARETGGRVVAVPTDTGDDASVTAMAETVRAAFGGVDDFHRQIDWVANACRTATPRPGGEPVRLPGERGMRRYREQQTNGVALFDGIMASLEPWAKKLEVATPKELA